MRLSISKLKTFKACRRLYQLRYIENMKPVKTAEALEVGKNYHELLEWLNTNGSFDGIDEDYSKEQAMASAYAKYIYPKFKVVEAEKWLTYEFGNDNDVLVGCADAIADDGHIVEYKTTSMEITEQYEYNLQWDEQILAYMLMTGHRKVHYVVCRKPTIRQKQNESDEEFFHRMVEWYDVDTDSKIRLLEIERTDEEVEQFKDDLMAMVDEMKCIEHHKNYYRNNCHCDKYGRRCEYSSICLNYDPNQTYIDFVKEENEYDGSKKDEQ